MLLKLPIKILLCFLILGLNTALAQESSAKWYGKALGLLKEAQVKLVSYADNTYGRLDVVLEGLNVLTQKDLENLLPSDKSFYWWCNNKENIIASLKQHPLIAQATIDSCPEKYPYRCFAISIKERIPSLWVKAEWEDGQENRFLIADDGVVLSVLKGDQQIEALSKFDRSLLARFRSQQLTNLPLLDARNLASASDAPAQLFNRAVELVTTIQRESASQVYELRFIGADEIEVEFASQPYKLIFNIGAENALDDRIAAQLKRLDKILEAKPQLASRATSINLGLEREAYAVLIKG